MFPEIAIAGVGLIGGSIALAVRRAWPAVRIVGFDRPEILAAARASGAIDAAAREVDALCGADLIVLAAPVRQNTAWLQQLAPRLRAGMIVTDVGSTKGEILRVADELSPAASFVGGHPLAGAAAQGFAASRADLFDGEPWLLATPAPEPALPRLEAFVEALGARPVRIRGDSHDALLAHTSHLPQLAISALLHTIGSAVGQEGLALAGPGLRDSTRLASSPFEIWQDIIATNAQEIGRALDAYIAALGRIRADIAPLALPAPPAPSAPLAPSAPEAPLAPEAPPAPKAPKAPDLSHIFQSACRWKRTLNAATKKPAL